MSGKKLDFVQQGAKINSKVTKTVKNSKSLKNGSSKSSLKSGIKRKTSSGDHSGDNQMMGSMATSQKEPSTFQRPKDQSNPTYYETVASTVQRMDYKETTGAFKKGINGNARLDPNLMEKNLVIHENGEISSSSLAYAGRDVDNTAEWNHYLKVNSKMPTSYTDYANTKIRWRPSKEYRLLRHIGKGKYSEVFVAKKKPFIDHLDNENEAKEEYRVVKVLRPIRYVKLLREVKILNDIKGHNNIIKLLDVVQDKASSTYAFIFDYMHTDDHKKIFSSFTIYDCQHYIYQILLGLDYIHSRGIMHRDIKPHNIIYNVHARTLKIIDFGLAEYYIENNDYVVRVASKNFKGPELLVKYQKYDYALDIWGLGCIFASMLFMKEPFFHGENNEDMLVKITSVLGFPELQAYLEKYKINYDNNELNKMRSYKSRRWQVFYKTKYIERVSTLSLDLLDSFLVMDHRCRISARQAIRHPYFSSVRCIYGENDS